MAEPEKKTEKVYFEVKPCGCLHMCSEGGQVTGFTLQVITYHLLNDMNNDFRKSQIHFPQLEATLAIIHSSIVSESDCSGCEEYQPSIGMA